MAGAVGGVWREEREAKKGRPKMMDLETRGLTEQWRSMTADQFSLNLNLKDQTKMLFWMGRKISGQDVVGVAVVSKSIEASNAVGKGMESNATLGKWGRGPVGHSAWGR